MIAQHQKLYFALTASGLSEKSLNYITEEDMTLAIKGLIEEFFRTRRQKLY